MKNHSKLSILITMTLAMTMAISAVFAVPVPIGMTKQVQPFESNPTANVKAPAVTGWNVGTPTLAYDGDDFTSTILKVTTTTVTTPATLIFSGFTVPAAPEPFLAGWVDLKMIYEVPTQTGDDTYKVDYSTDGTTWVSMIPARQWVNGAFAKAIVPFPQVATSDGGAWDWSKIANLRVRVTFTRGGTAWELSRNFILYEIWATVYALPLPPVLDGIATLSVMPPVVVGVPENPGLLGTDNIFFVDVYAQGLTGLGAGLWGYQFTLLYDTNVITAMDYWSYYPFVGAAPSAIDDTAGSVAISYFTFAGDTVGFTGDKTPLARIYFMVDAGGGGGSTALDLVSSPPTYITELKPVGQAGIVPSLSDGHFGSSSYLSFTAGIYPGGDPTTTTWHEDYPTFSRTWTVTGWIDNGDGTLSASDQLMMTVGGLEGQYHVDQVTITIHWTFKPTGEGKADPEDPTTIPDPPEFDPTASRWHQIYPVYCRTFAITGWIDNGDGIFSVSDQFTITYDDDSSTADAHLDSITTNILVSLKGPGVPEFPFGIGMVMALVPMIAIAYVWRIRKRTR